jgi:hypothetical protein
MAAGTTYTRNEVDEVLKELKLYDEVQTAAAIVVVANPPPNFDRGFERVQNPSTDLNGRLDDARDWIRRALER